MIVHLGAGGDYYSFGAPSDPPLTGIARLEVHGEDGDDRISFHGEGIDYLADGGAGDDILRDDLAGSHDTMRGGAGNDRLFGSSDSLDGGVGDDLLVAEPGWRLESGAVLGDTTPTGGAGRDLFMLDGDSDWLAADGGMLMADVRITDYEPGETLYLPPLLSRHSFDGDPDTHHQPGHLFAGYSLTEAEGGTVLTATWEPLAEGGAVVTRSVTLEGFTGLNPADIVIGYRSTDTGDPVALVPVTAGTAMAERVHVAGGEGADSLALEAEHAVGSLGGGDDVLTLEVAPPTGPYPRDQVIAGGTGNDRITASGPLTSHAVIDGQDGDDTLVASLAGTFDGGAGDDVIDITGAPLGTTTSPIAAHALGGEGADQITMHQGQAADLGADAAADRLTLDLAPAWSDMVASEITNLRDGDRILVETPPGDHEPVTAELADGLLTIRWAGQAIGTARFSGDAATPLIDPGNPDALVSVLRR